jgi:delta24(24(1))-sterol reductase
MVDSDALLVKEFGGSFGATLLMLWSHAWMYYLWLSLEYYQGGVFFPDSLEQLSSQLSKAVPTWESAGIYLSFMTLQAVLAATMPGPLVKGLPVPPEGNIQHTYRCNAVPCWYITLTTAFTLHYTGVFRLTTVMDKLGSIMSVAIIFGDVVSVTTYVSAILLKKTTRMSGSHIYDFFMGAWLNPRIGSFDLKMFAEIRGSWVQLFLLTLSAAMKQLEDEGAISNSMCVMLLAHGLYSNACMKGEECVPTTWDIFYEKWGWMLIYWNFAGVPFVYCFQSFYILKNSPQLSPFKTASLMVVLLFAYYIWDTAQSQKNRFRMKLRGTFVPRKTFPQLPWGTLESPRYLKTESGSYLLTDGWWRYARKIHYSADIVMASIWGLSCGFSGLLPYFYPCFFTGMILHRYFRDQERCQRKYGADWVKYCETVKYAFIPYVF